jgi:hypothetical protein
MGRWLSGTLMLGAALVAALAAMQAPALTQDYLAALDQIATEARREVDETIAAARRQHRIAASADEPVVAQLKSRDAKTAERLMLGIERARTLRQDQERLAAEPALRRPAAIAWDAWQDADGYKRTVLRSAIERLTPALHLDLVSATYALAGLVVALIVVQLPLALLRLIGRLLPWRRRRQVEWYVPQRDAGRRPI